MRKLPPTHRTLPNAASPNAEQLNLKKISEEASAAKLFASPRRPKKPADEPVINLDKKIEFEF